MDVHARSLHAFERLGHERGVDAVVGGDLADREPEGHHAVGHRERVGVAQVDLLLAGCVLVEAVLDRDAERFECPDGLLAQFPGDVARGQVEVAALVDRDRQLAGDQRLEVEELDVGGHVEGEAFVMGRLHVATQDLAGITLERCAVEMVDVAEDPGLGHLRVAPRQQLERVGVGHRQHVGFLDAGEPVDRRTVEGHPVFEGVLELCR